MSTSIRFVRSVPVATLAALLAAMLCLVSSVGVGISLLAGTVLIMGGNDNSDGVGMDRIVSAYFNPAQPGSPFSDYEFQVVPWDSSIGGNGYEPNQAGGVVVIDGAIGDTVTARPAEPVAVVGYSSSANVVIRELRNLDAAGNRDAEGNLVDPALVDFYVIGSPNRPGGGIVNRLSVFGPVLGALTGVAFDGPNPDTDYDLTDIAWKYDPISDFPIYPLNPFSLVNTGIGFFTLHSDYSKANLDPTSAGYNVDDNPNLTYVDPDTGIRYVTLNPPELPLLAPFERLGVPPQLLDVVRPALTVLVEAGYDRTVPVGQVQPARLLPPPSALAALGPNLVDAVVAGVTGGSQSKQVAPNLDSPNPALGSTSTDPVRALAAVPSSPKTETVRAAARPTAAAPTPAAPPKAIKPGFKLVRDPLRAIVGSLGLRGPKSPSPSAPTSPKPSTAPQPAGAEHEPGTQGEPGNEAEQKDAA